MGQTFELGKRAARDRARSGARHPGFTLIELMVTLVVVAIVTMIALPAYRTLSQENRRAAAVNDFVGALNYARNEALTRHAPVSLCRSSTPLAAVPACDGSTAGTGWESGWLIFVDDDGSGDLSAAELAANDLLRQHPALDSNGGSNPILTLRGNAAVKDAITFNPYGMPANSGSLAFCDSRGWGKEAREIDLGAAGRIQTLTPTVDAGVTLTSCTP